MTVDFQRRAIREELAGQSIRQQESLTAGMQQVYFLADPIGLGAARAEGHFPAQSLRTPCLGSAATVASGSRATRDQPARRQRRPAASRLAKAARRWRAPEW